MMSNTRKWMLYSIFTIAVTIFFIYYLFPSGTVKNIITSNFNAANPSVNITIDHINPVFPPGLKLHHVNLFYMDDNLLTAEEIEIVPNLLSLFRPRIIFIFKGKALNGFLKGRGEFAKNIASHNFMVEGKLSDIQIKKISAVKYYLGRQLSGMLKGNFNYRSSGESGESLEAGLIVSDGEVELSTPVVKLGSIPFSKIEADLTMRNQKLRIKRCTIRGAQMDATISGMVSLKEPPGKSYLKLSGVIKPKPLFFEKPGKDVLANLLPENVLNKKVIRIRIYGTLENPRFFLN